MAESGTDPIDPTRSRSQQQELLLTLLIRTVMMEGGASTSTGSFSFPPFHSYPPSFTLQPVRETRDKQSAMWGDLILAYCRQHKVGGCTMRLPGTPCHHAMCWMGGVAAGELFSPATATLALARLFWPPPTMQHQPSMST